MFFSFGDGYRSLFINVILALWPFIFETSAKLCVSDFSLSRTRQVDIINSWEEEPTKCTSERFISWIISLIQLSMNVAIQTDHAFIVDWMTIFFQSAQKKKHSDRRLIFDQSRMNRPKKKKFRKFVEQISSSSVCIPRCYSKYSMTMHIELKQLPISIDMNVFHQTASASSVMRCGKIERCWKISHQTETLYFFSFFVFFIRSTCCYISFFAICLISKRSIENE